jgi:hypothetical protein
MKGSKVNYILRRIWDILGKNTTNNIFMIIFCRYNLQHNTTQITKYYYKILFCDKTQNKLNFAINFTILNAKKN